MMRPVFIVSSSVDRMATLPRLAAVELQLIAHALDLHSILALARCCLSTLQALSSDFTFRALAPIVVSTKLHPQFGQAIRSSLLRFADLRLRIGSTLLEPQANPDVGRVRVLDLRGCAVDTLPGLFDRLVLHQVHTIVMGALGSMISAAALGEAQMQLQRLPALRTVRFVSAHPSSLTTMRALVNGLVSLEVLQIWLSTSDYWATVTLWPELVQSAALRKLTLRGSGILKNSAQQLLRTPALDVRLQELVLHDMDSSYEEWPEVFSALASLRSLVLRHCRQSLHIFQVAAFVSASLTHIRLEPSGLAQKVNGFEGCGFPLLVACQAVCERRGNGKDQRPFRIELVLQSLATKKKREYRFHKASAAAIRSWQRVLDEAAALVVRQASEPCSFHLEVDWIFREEDPEASAPNPLPSFEEILDPLSLSSSSSSSSEEESESDSSDSSDRRDSSSESSDSSAEEKSGQGDTKAA